MFRNAWYLLWGGGWAGGGRDMNWGDLRPEIRRTLLRRADVWELTCANKKRPASGIISESRNFVGIYVILGGVGEDVCAPAT